MENFKAFLARAMTEDALRRENARLAQQVRRLQDVVQTMRDEIGDANAEIAASQRLFEEQKGLLLQELQRERAWREQLQRRLAGSAVARSTVGTSTANEVSTNTVSDAGTMTQQQQPTAMSRSGGGGDSWGASDIEELSDGGGTVVHFGTPHGTTSSRRQHYQHNHQYQQHHHQQHQQYRPSTHTRDAGTGPPQSLATSSSHGGWPPKPVFAAPDGVGVGGYPRAPPFSADGRAADAPRFGRDAFVAMPAADAALSRFVEWLAQRSGLPSAALGRVVAALGAASVDELCGNVTERDLVELGVPVLKARSVMHAVMEHTSALLAAAEAGTRVSVPPPVTGGFGVLYPASASPSFCSYGGVGSPAPAHRW